MNVFSALMAIGITMVFFSYVWPFITLPFAILAAAINDDVVIVYLMRAVSYYILVSIISLIVLALVGSSGSLFVTLLYSFLGVFIIYIILGSSMYQSRREAAEEFNLSALKVMEHDGHFLLGSLIFYGVALFFPILVVNKFNVFILSTIDWIYGLPLMGIIVSIVAIFAVINLGYFGLIFSGAVIASFYNKLFGKSEA